MQVLVAIASRHEATREIGEIVTKQLTNEGITSTLESPENVDSLATYDAVILGSGVYAGRWLKAARSFAKKHQKELLAMPVWLLSSGPLEKPPFKKTEKFVVVDDIIENVKPFEHRIFAGKLDKSKLNMAEKLVIKAVKANEGDYRDEDEIIKWTDSVIRHLEDFKSS